MVMNQEDGRGHVGQEKSGEMDNVGPRNVDVESDQAGGDNSE